MSRLYGDYPQTFGRVKSVLDNPAQYACAVERTSGHETRGDLAVKWVVRVGFVFVVALLVVEKFA